MRELVDAPADGGHEAFHRGLIIPGGPEGVTQLLEKWSGGDRDALDQLMPLVYDELRRLAGNYLRRERADHTLQPTALVNEAYLLMAGSRTAY